MLQEDELQRDILHLNVAHRHLPMSLESNSEPLGHQDLILDICIMSVGICSK